MTAEAFFLEIGLSGIIYLKRDPWHLSKNTLFPAIIALYFFALIPRAASGRPKAALRRMADAQTANTRKGPHTP
jgi:hypothetical protein